jgi:glycosyltransferase involved in cell wall biosynthesis
MIPARPGLLVFSDDWGRHLSSCQHLVRRLTPHYRILWVNSIGTRRFRPDRRSLRRVAEKLLNWTRGLQQVGERMWVADLPMLPYFGSPMSRWANRLLAGQRLRAWLRRLRLAHPVVLTTLPHTYWLLEGVPRRGLIYYCTDDYSHWQADAGAAMRQADAALSAKADLILAASRELFARHGGAGRCEYFPHGVDYDHFASAGTRKDVPADLAGLPGSRIGFFGLVYEKLDFDLLGAVARQLAPASVVLIGPVQYCPAAFARHANVHLLGPRPYEELPRYLAGLDVLLLPYAVDAMVYQSNPLKLRECLATGRPTVSVDIPEARPFRPHLRVAASHGEFVRQIREALREPRAADQSRARQERVAGDCWDRAAGKLREWIDALFTPGRFESWCSPPEGGRR